MIATGAVLVQGKAGAAGAAVIRRTRSLPESAMYRLPEVSTARPIGPSREALADGPPSPLKPPVVRPPAFTCTNTAPVAITSIASASAYGDYVYFSSGSWLEIKGTNLADPSDPHLNNASHSGQWSSADFNGNNAPTVLDGVSVSINGKPAYVWYLSPTQLNVQAPEDSATGNVAITVTNCKATGPSMMFARRALAPGLLAPSTYVSAAPNTWWQPSCPTEPTFSTRVSAHRSG